jgi:hypothetical protein
MRMIIHSLLILVIFFMYLISYNKYNRMKKVTIEEVYEIENKCKPLYKYINMKNVFKKYPQRIKGVRFAFLCPMAIKTIEYLHDNSSKIDENILNNILLLTNFQFFIEIFVIYKDYIDEEIYRNIRSILKNKSCEISKTIKNEITNLFINLPLNIQNNLPDDSYQKRHNLLICSKNKELADERIQLLKSIYGNVESFNNAHSKCFGKRDGVSGCRNCCMNYYSGNYSKCVNSCMDF